MRAEASHSRRISDLSDRAITRHAGALSDGISDRRQPYGKATAGWSGGLQHHIATVGRRDPARDRETKTGTVGAGLDERVARRCAVYEPLEQAVQDGRVDPGSAVFNEDAIPRAG